MSLQRFSAKKVARIARLTGLDLQMVWGGSGHRGGPMFQARTYDDCHYLVNVDTGEVALTYDRNTRHTSSCPGGSDFNPAEWAR